MKIRQRSLIDTSRAHSEMIVERPFRVWALSGMVVLACLGAGCGTKKEIKAERSAEQIHILKMVSLWSGFGAANGRKPANAGEIKVWAKKLKPEELAPYGITDLDKALTSPRDGQPYGILRPTGNRMGIGNVIYEKTGINGWHMVASNMGTVSELNDEELKTLLPKAP